MAEQTSFSKWYHRKKFLEAISEVNPAVLRHLSQRCNPAFLKLVVIESQDERPSLDPRHYSSFWLDDRNKVAYLPRRSGPIGKYAGHDAIDLGYFNLDSTEGQALRKELATWARAFFLDADWLLDAALLTLLDWLIHPGKDPQHLRFYIVRWGLPSNAPRERLQLHWKLGETRKQVQSRVEEYLDDLAAWRLSQGFDPGNRNKSDKYRWLAMFQTKRQSPDCIRKGSDLSPTTAAIDQGIKQAANAIGLERRFGNRGPSRLKT